MNGEWIHLFFPFIDLVHPPITLIHHLDFAESFTQPFIGANSNNGPSGTLNTQPYDFKNYTAPNVTYDKNVTININVKPAPAPAPKPAAKAASTASVTEVSVKMNYIYVFTKIKII